MPLPRPSYTHAEATSADYLPFELREREVLQEYFLNKDKFIEVRAWQYSTCLRCALLIKIIRLKGSVRV